MPRISPGRPRARGRGRRDSERPQRTRSSSSLGSRRAPAPRSRSAARRARTGTDRSSARPGATVARMASRAPARRRPPPRGAPAPCGPGRPALRHVYLDPAVLNHDGEGLHRLVGRKAQRAAAADVELRPVPRADDDALLGVELALGERAVIMGTAVLDRAILAVEVVDADRDLARANDLQTPVGAHPPEPRRPTPRATGAPAGA